MNSARKTRDWFVICSWVVLLLVFAGLVAYMTIHAEDLLDADMSSELVLGQHLSQTGGILSNQWYYSTEIRVLNTQLVYDFFFHLFDDWQTVRIFSNITLYLVLLFSFFFLCKRLNVERYFPLSAAVMLLPLSAPYFYILLYGAYYIPRVSMMLMILGALLPLSEQTRRSAGSLALCLIACLLSFALGLEGARMLLILFVPLGLLVGGEFAGRVCSRSRKTPSQQLAELRQAGFLRYACFVCSACVLSVLGYFVNQNILAHNYPFEQYGEMTLSLTIGSIKSALFKQIQLIGYSSLSQTISVVIWVAIGILFAWYLLSKSEKSLAKHRFVWLNILSWACYTAFCSLINFGQVAWHMVPVAVLFIPGVSVVLSEIRLKSALRRIFLLLMSVCFLYIGVQGYTEFDNWYVRAGSRTNQAFHMVTDVLEEQGYRNGYATFWNANILTELSDGMITVWCVESFDEDTIQQPDLFRWLQDKSHDAKLPEGKTFVLWTAQELETYGKQNFAYLGEVLFQNNAVVVYAVKP